MADFQFLRNTPVDLKRYLPKFLFRDPTMFAVFETLSEEHERQRSVLRDAVSQLYIKTATWGLDDWEEFLGLEDNASDNLNSRRSEILLKLAGVESVTVPFLTQIVNLYVADAQASIIDYPQKYSLEVLYHGGQVTDYEKLRTAISTYIPAHIGYKLVTITNGNLEYHGAGTVQCYRHNTIDMTVSYHNSVQDSARHIAGFVTHNYKQISIWGGNIKWLNFHH